MTMTRRRGHLPGSRVSSCPSSHPRRDGRSDRATVLLLAAAIDWQLGEPPASLHPVVWMGRLISLAEPTLLGGSSRRQLLLGGALAAGGMVGWFLVGWTLDRLLCQSPLLLPVRAWLLKCCLAWRALNEEAARVEGALARGDLEAARAALRSLVSRETATLDRSQVAAAAIESVAENVGDSLVGPALAFAVAGLGGAFAYRWVNTADAMIGYRGRYEWAGKLAARLDDAANFLPSRLAAALLLIAGPRRRAGLRALWHDHGATASPNAGWPMAAMAGLLGRALEKPGYYRLNAAAPPPDGGDIAAARSVAGWAWLLLLGGLALALRAGRR